MSDDKTIMSEEMIAKGEAALAHLEEAEQALKDMNPLM